MSETRKAGAPREPQPNRAAETPDTAPRRDAPDAPREATAEIQHLTEQAEARARQGMGEARRTTEAGVDATLRTVQTATDAAQHTMDGSKAAATAVGEKVADTQARIWELGLGRSRHALASAAHVMDIYRDTTESSAAHVRGLLTCYLALGRGVQRIQHALLDQLNEAVEHAPHKPSDLLRCKSMVEMAEVQRDLYLTAVNYAVESSSLLFELAGQAAQDAVRPLHEGH